MRDKLQSDAHLKSLIEQHVRSAASAGLVVPVAVQKPRVLTAKFPEGVTYKRTDNYYWLRDDKRCTAVGVDVCQCFVPLLTARSEQAACHIALKHS